MCSASLQYNNQYQNNQDIILEIVSPTKESDIDVIRKHCSWICA